MSSRGEIDPPDGGSPDVAPVRYDAVLFDMGYTLIYFDPPQEVIVQEALRAVGVERSVDQVHAAVQEVWGEYYRDEATDTFPASEEYDRRVEAELQRRLLSHLGVKADDKIYQVYDDSLAARFARPGTLRPYPEVAEVLAALRDQGYRLGIVSNWSWNLRSRVAQVGLDGFFQVVWASAYAGCSKPHPAIFHQALAQMDVSPRRAFYVGDSYRHDVIGARNAGLDVALLDRNGTAGDPGYPVIHDLWGLFDLLDRPAGRAPSLPSGVIARPVV